MWLVACSGGVDDVLRPVAGAFYIYRRKASVSIRGETLSERRDFRPSKGDPFAIWPAASYTAG